MEMKAPCSQPRPARSIPPRAIAPAFTLIELLVVIGIVALLIGILLPTLGAARQQAQITACASNQRQLAIATNAYLIDAKQVTPNGHYNNVSGDTGPWPTSAAALINAYMPVDPERFYDDPAAGGPDDAYEITGDQPYDGADADDVFRPNYFYMAVPWILAGSGPDFHLGEMWGPRNAANIQIDAVPQPRSEIVIWVDESTSQHTGTQDIYQRNAAGEEARDLSNFAYVDGHVETKRFDDLRGYFESLHNPIPQTNVAGFGPGSPVVDYTRQANWGLRFSFPAGL